MKKKLALLLSVVFLATSVAACNPDSTDNNDDSNEQEDSEMLDDNESEEKTKVALLTDPAGTQVFILRMIDALEDYKDEYNFEPIIAESADAAAYEDNAYALIEEGVDLIIGGSWMAQDSMEKIASEFPDAAKYALIDTESDNPNLKSIGYREQEGAYLIGMIAAMVTDEDDNVFGSVNMNQGAGSWKWRYGYMEGVKRLRPEAEFLFNYTESFNDPAKAKEFAIQQAEQGAKFVNASCAGGDKGVFEAALEEEFYTSGQDVDLTTPDNPYIVSSQIKDTYETVRYLLELYFSDKEWTGENEVWGIEEGVIGAVHVTHESENPRTDRLSDEDVEVLKGVVEEIKSGELNLKDMPDEEDYVD